MKKYNFEPILKWVGGKRQILNEIEPLIPKYTNYCEPFVGGGAVVFKIQPNKGVINDLNKELINVYRVVKSDPTILLKYLNNHSEKNCKEYFYEVRKQDRLDLYDGLSSIEKAARIIYLNKTCYNGLYRVNADGHFNSPYGRYKNPNIVNEKNIIEMSRYFNENNIKIEFGDFRDALKGLRKGAFVYLDPPYVPMSSSASFTGYTENGFNNQMQRELKNTCDMLNNKGIKFLQSNSDTPIIRELYKEYNIKTIKAKRSINSKGDERGEINEVLILNYDEKSLL